MTSPFQYVQFGNTFNLLHAAASFISVHQNSVGVAGVSDKYGKRSWARYPALWTLKTIDSLPNPDPTDIAALDEEPIAVEKVVIDVVAEKLRPENKRLTQEWAGIKQDPTADLFVFVGRWSKQKGVDLIADVMPSLLEKKPKIQLVCVGPVIVRLRLLLPLRRRVFSKLTISYVRLCYISPGSLRSIRCRETRSSYGVCRLPSLSARSPC